MAVILHGYFRSSASWRVRIALTMKGIAFEQRNVDLRIGEQTSATFCKLNPQGLVPALEIDGSVLTQSLAIIEYLNETRPEPPLLGSSPTERARIRALALAVACEIHPLQNLSVLRKIGADRGEDASKAWAYEINARGMATMAALLGDEPRNFCVGGSPTMADIFLIPQMANARRFGVDMVWPLLNRIETTCRALPAFATTAPEAHIDPN